MLFGWIVAQGHITSARAALVRACARAAVAVASAPAFNGAFTHVRHSTLTSA